MSAKRGIPVSKEDFQVSKGEQEKRRLQEAIYVKSSALIGKVLNNSLRIVKLIGSGATSNTYLAKKVEHNDIHVPKKIAVKIYRPWVLEVPRQADRILREVSSISDVDHPNLMKVYGYGIHQEKDSNLVYLKMEYLPGITLTQFVERSEKPIKYDVIYDVMYQICLGIKTLHDNGIIHRDLKPDNIMAVMNDGRATFKVMDFGVIKKIDEATITDSGEFLGTLRYASPEWVLGKDVDFSSDLYSIGAILYKLITRMEPFYWARRNRTSLALAVLEESLLPKVSRLFSDLRSLGPLERHLDYLTRLGSDLTMREAAERIQRIDRVIEAVKQKECSEWWTTSRIREIFDRERIRALAGPWYIDWIEVAEFLEKRANVLSDAEEIEKLLAKSIAAYAEAIEEGGFQASSTERHGKWMVRGRREGKTAVEIREEIAIARKLHDELKNRLKALVETSKHKLPVFFWSPDGTGEIGYVDSRQFLFSFIGGKLDREKPSELLRKFFELNCYQLSDDAKVSSANAYEWTIRDGLREYIIREIPVPNWTDLHAYTVENLKLD